MLTKLVCMLCLASLQCAWAEQSYVDVYNVVYYAVANSNMNTCQLAAAGLAVNAFIRLHAAAACLL